MNDVALEKASIAAFKQLGPVWNDDLPDDWCDRCKEWAWDIPITWEEWNHYNCQLGYDSKHDLRADTIRDMVRAAIKEYEAQLMSQIDAAAENIRREWAALGTNARFPKRETIARWALEGAMQHEISRKPDESDADSREDREVHR